MPKEKLTPEIWTGKTETEAEEDVTETQVHHIDQNGQDCEEKDAWLSKSDYYYVRVQDGQLKHKQFTNPLYISDAKMVKVDKNVYHMYLNYVCNASQTSYNAANSEMQLQGYNR